MTVKVTLPTRLSMLPLVIEQLPVEEVMQVWVAPPLKLPDTVTPDAEVPLVKFRVVTDAEAFQLRDPKVLLPVID